MHNVDPVDTFIDRIVANAHIPGRTRREDLRRELRTHFNDAGNTHVSPEETLRRFGSASIIAESFERLYRWDFRLFYLMKIAAAIVASTIAALALEAVANLNLARDIYALHLSPGFTYGAGAAIAVVLASAAAWETLQRPFVATRAVTAGAVYLALALLLQQMSAHSFDAFVSGTLLVGLAGICSRLKPSLGKLPLVLSVFAAEIYANHLLQNVNLSATQALRSGAILAAVWSITLLIFSRFDHVFLSYFETRG